MRVSGYGVSGYGYGLMKNSPRPTRTCDSGLRGTNPADHAELYSLSLLYRHPNRKFFSKTLSPP
jgi:hypothetical protein